MMHRLPPVRIVDHPGHHHEPVHSRCLGRLGGVAGILGGELRHSVEHRNPAVSHLDRRFQDPDLLIKRQGTVLSDRSQHDQAVNPFPDQGLDVLLRSREVKGEILVELRGHSRKNPGPVYLQRHGRR